MCLAMNSFIVLTALFVFLYLGTDLHFSLNGIIYILSNSGVSFATLVFIVVVFGLSSTFVSLIFSAVIFLPSLLLFTPLTSFAISVRPARSDCCKIVLIIFPLAFLNSSGLNPLFFLLPYFVLIFFF